MSPLMIGVEIGSRLGDVREEEGLPRLDHAANERMLVERARQSREHRAHLVRDSIVGSLDEDVLQRGVVLGDDRE